MPVARQQYTDGNGAPLVGGRVAFCQPGTSGTVFMAVFADINETIPLQNPVPLDSAGITFSGGSQVSVWGSGTYEQFVYDADGNLIYSALVSASTIVSNNFQGTVTIVGNLEVTGSITDTQSLTTPVINGNNAIFTGNVNAGALNTGSANVSGSLQVNNAATIGGQVTAGGLATSGITSTAVLNAVDVTISPGGGVNLSGTNIGNIGTVSAATVQTDSLTVNGVPIGGVGNLKAQGGSFATNENNFNYDITFSQAFNSIIALTATSGVSAAGDGAGGPLSIVGLSATGGTISVPYANQPSVGTGLATSWTIYWIAVGT